MAVKAWDAARAWVVVRARGVDAGWDVEEEEAWDGGEEGVETGEVTTSFVRYDSVSVERNKHCKCKEKREDSFTTCLSWQERTDRGHRSDPWIGHGMYTIRAGGRTGQRCPERRTA